MFFFGFPMPFIARGMTIAAGRRQRFIAQSVAHMAHIYEFVGHMRSAVWRNQCADACIMRSALVAASGPGWQTRTAVFSKTAFTSS
jgi:hypothetical protein